jgi:hypothetical protein
MLHCYPSFQKQSTEYVRESGMEVDERCCKGPGPTFAPPQPSSVLWRMGFGSA